VVARARRLERYLTQPFHVTEAFTGQVGYTVPLEAALADCVRILSGELSEVPESAFYMIGTLAEAGL
jgi:F-type H+-transporting ATPase subunit beta